MSISRHGLGARITRWLAGACAVAAVAVVLLNAQSKDSHISAWMVHADVSAGIVLAAADVSRVGVVVPDATKTSLLRSNPVGARLVTAIAAGSLLRTDDITNQSASSDRVVSLTIDSGHVPTSLKRGASVDVWVTPSAAIANNDQVRSVQVATSVLVKSAGRPAATGAITVELQVPRRGVAALVAASHAGSVDLVSVPPRNLAGVQ